MVIKMKDDFIITSIHRVIMIDKYEYPEKVITFNNDLKHNELIFRFSGSANVLFNDSVLNESAGTIRFLPKGQAKNYTVKKIESGECIDIFFDTDKPVSYEAFAENYAHNRIIHTLFKKAFTAWVSKSEGSYFETISLIYKIFAEMKKDDYIPDNKFLLIKPAIEYIENNFYDPEISVESLAGLCGISYPYLKKIFIAKFGVPPKKYISQLKMNFACELLKEGNFNISRISSICGFNDIYFFSKQFKKYLGITPSQFREKYKSSK